MLRNCGHGNKAGCFYVRSSAMYLSELPRKRRVNCRPETRRDRLFRVPNVVCLICYAFYFTASKAGQCTCSVVARTAPCEVVVSVRSKLQPHVWPRFKNIHSARFALLRLLRSCSFVVLQVGQFLGVPLGPQTKSSQGTYITQRKNATKAREQRGSIGPEPYVRTCSM